eukprot:3058891-Rhodomonas_salina.1
MARAQASTAYTPEVSLEDQTTTQQRWYLLWTVRVSHRVALSNTTYSIELGRTCPVVRHVDSFL